MVKLRVLIGVDGLIWLDKDTEVEQVDVNDHHDVRDVGTTPNGAVIRELTGKNQITIDYRDKTEAEPERLVL